MFPAWTMEFKKVVQIESSKGTALIPTLFLMTVRPRELMGRITAGPHTASKAKALFSRPHYPTLTVHPQEHKLLYLRVTDSSRQLDQLPKKHLSGGYQCSQDQSHPSIQVQGSKKKKKSVLRAVFL